MYVIQTVILRFSVGCKNFFKSGMFILSVFSHKIGKSELNFLPKYTEMTGKPRCKILSHEVGVVRRD